MSRYILAFDVGGTSIKAAVVKGNGEVLDSSVQHYDSKANGSKEEMIEHLVHLIVIQAAYADGPNDSIAGIGYAFPGPFDYKKGISHVRSIGKFDSLFGVSLRDEILVRLDRDYPDLIPGNIPIVFENDASLFGLGQYDIGHARKYKKSICLTLGTGLGSVFIEEGSVITRREDVPEGGWVYHLPFGSSILDDYLSRRGILRLAEQEGLDPKLDVRELAALTDQGNEITKKVFLRFGENLGRGLKPVVQKFRPEALIFGGQIAKCSRHFLEVMKVSLDEPHLDVIPITEEGSRSTFAGIARLVKETLRQSRSINKPDSR